jgi:hypothetical protein
MTFDLVKLEPSSRALFDGFDRECSTASMSSHADSGYATRLDELPSVRG